MSSAITVVSQAKKKNTRKLAIFIKSIVEILLI